MITISTNRQIINRVQTLESDFRKIHGDKYSYDQSIYVKSSLKMSIKCSRHGEFYQSPSHHLRGQGCPLCAKDGYTTDFIKKAKKVHKDTYDYSKVDYRGSKQKVCIVCIIHGEFYQRPCDHLLHKGCPLCARDRYRSNTADFIKKAKEIHKDTYDYSKVDYEAAHNKINIICPIHGEFYQTPNNHLQGKGCLSCRYVFRRDKIIDFVQKAKEIHGDLYNYSKVDYIDTYRKVHIICKEHGPFYMRPNNHLMGQGCPFCAISGFKMDQPAILYHIAVGAKAYKIGITNRTIEARFTKEDRRDIKILWTIQFEEGYFAYYLEQLILEHMPLYTGPALLSSGNTELLQFPIEIEKIKEIAGTLLFG